MAGDLARRGPGLVERVAAERQAVARWRIAETEQPHLDYEVLEARQPKEPERSGFEYGVPPGGLNEYNQGVGAATQTDRRTLMQQLYESYVACPWAWACINAIARTITAGGLVVDWDADTDENDQEEPEKPPEVRQLEALLAYVNPREDVRQLMRNVIVDLLVFGDSFLEIVWWGNQPVALYNLDSPSMMPQADEHGTIIGYVQMTDFSQRAEFEARDVIHISLDSPRSGIFGVSPTQANLLPITSWLFAASCGKEMARKGLPATFHADFPAGTQQPEMNRWLAMYAARNIGPRNIGTPIATKGGAKLTEIQAGKLAEIMAYLSQKRDEIIAGYGAYPAKVGVIESGNLGGGTGEAQDKSFRVNTCQPIAEIVLEKLNFHVTAGGFGIKGWHLRFQDIDWRDSLIVEQIRDMRLRNGTWTNDRYRADIDEPPIDGGSDPVLVDRQNLVLWSDMAAMSKAMIASKGAPAVAAGETPPGGEQMTGAAPGTAPGVPGGQPQDGQPQPGESLYATQYARYQARLREALQAADAGYRAFTEYKAERYG